MMINILVVPGAKIEKIEKQADLLGNIVYKIRTRAKPIDGDANHSIVEILSKYFEISKSLITILKGHKTKYKTIEIRL